MFYSRLNLRTGVSALLMMALSGIFPLSAAAALPMPLHNVTQIALQRPASPATPQPGTPAAPEQPASQEPASQQPTTPAESGASAAPVKHRVSPWVWAAIVAGIGAGVGAGVIAGNSQSGKSSAGSPTVTVNVGPGVTAGTPH